ncbi:hypothetical protein TNCV_164031 [Trichonephila clavipes]|nr:hypothetical protein TNCV_164031 [Trichonephila clavipes]
MDVFEQNQRYPIHSKFITPIGIHFHRQFRHRHGNPLPITVLDRRRKQWDKDSSMLSSFMKSPVRKLHTSNDKRPIAEVGPSRLRPSMRFNPLIDLPVRRTGYRKLTTTGLPVRCTGTNIFFMSLIGTDF